tara:strand:- start:606 stop:1751 length:1146 start_codon:yes stop_codon:yes gene_type:complete
MTLDELLLEWSYRSEKGYPCLGSPSDVLLLEEILNKLGLPSNQIISQLKEDEEVSIATDDEIEDEIEDEEPTKTIDTDGDGVPDKASPKGGDPVYDSVIRNHLGLSGDEPIPSSKNNYPFPGTGGSTFDIQVKSDDMKYWNDFWELTPPKAGKTTGSSKGSGFGELSLYWLYQYSNSSVEVRGTQGSDNPDLSFDGLGVEVKAYNKHTGKQGLGRFGQDTENLKMLGVIFGINALTTLFKGIPEEGKKADKDINPLTWDGKNLENAMEEVIKFKKIDIDQLAEIPGYDIFKMIKDNLEFLNNRLGEYSTAEEGARKMSLEFVKPKIARKPGQGGFLVNVLENGKCRFWQIDYEKILGNKDSLQHIKTSQGNMAMDFDELFG